MKKLLGYYEEATIVGSKATNHRIKGWEYLANVALVIYYGFGCFDIMYLQNSKITWKLPRVWESYQ